MRTVLCLLAALTMVLAVHESIVCPPDYCNNIQCSVELTKESCDGEFLPNSSFCACCPTCITYIKPGGYCNKALHEIILGSFQLQFPRCSPGYKCVRNICIPRNNFNN